MRATLRLLAQSPAIRLTLFTRANCSLCDDSKLVLSQLSSRRKFHYDEIDVMATDQQRWKELYEFDTPVLHIDRHESTKSTTADAKKLMHRFSEKEVDDVMNQVEKEK